MLPELASAQHSVCAALWVRRTGLVLVSEGWHWGLADFEVFAKWVLCLVLIALLLRLVTPPEEYITPPILLCPPVQFLLSQLPRQVFAIRRAALVHWRLRRCVLLRVYSLQGRYLILSACFRTAGPRLLGVIAEISGGYRVVQKDFIN